MSICLITQQYNQIRSGIGLYATNYIRWLSNNGYVTTVLVSDDCDLKHSSLPNITFIKLKRSAFDLSPNKWLSFSKSASKKIKHLPVFNVYHYTDGREAFFHPKNYTKKSKVVGNVNDYFIMDASLDISYYKKTFPSRWFLFMSYYNIAKPFDRKAIQKLGTVICNTKFVKSKLRTHYHLPENKLFVIYKSIDLERFSEKLSSSKKIFTSGTPSILFVAGGNYQKKGIITILKAINVLEKKYPRIELLVIGSDPTEKELIESLTKKYPAINRTKFIGNINNDDLPAYYKAADIFVRPSIMEAFGVTYLEAMASGTPAIGSNAGGTNELIKNNENGFLIDPHDYQKLAKLIESLYTDRHLYEKIVENGRLTVKKFTVEHMAKETISLYQI